MAGKIAHLFQRLTELQGSPPALARGTAVGVFIGFAPVMPFKALLILLLTVATRASTVAGLLVCTIICNPLTYLPLYYLAWWTGDLLLPGRASWAVLRASFETMRAAPLAEALTVAAHMGVDAAVVLLVGGLVLALPLALCSYPAACRFFLMVERKRREKHRLDAAGGQAG